MTEQTTPVPALVAGGRWADMSRDRLGVVWEIQRVDAASALCVVVTDNSPGEESLVGLTGLIPLARFVPREGGLAPLPETTTLRFVVELDVAASKEGTLAEAASTIALVFGQYVADGSYPFLNDHGMAIADHAIWLTTPAGEEPLVWGGYEGPVVTDAHVREALPDSEGALERLVAERAAHATRHGYDSPREPGYVSGQYSSGELVEVARDYLAWVGQVPGYGAWRRESEPAPSGDAVEDLVRAAALLTAEADRLLAERTAADERWAALSEG